MPSSFRVLTVGDGDISYSLALKRAYPQISVTASTLVETSAELYHTYSCAADSVKELRDVWKECILFGVDATNLEGTIKGYNGGEEEKFDIILFNHPHLGDNTLLQSEQRHAENHFALLSHYFFSAKKLVKENGRIHVCLCGNQPRSWNVIAAAEQCNGLLQCISQQSTACPIDRWLFNGDVTYDLAEVQSHYPTKRKFRNGSLGSKHFLARYGYKHQRTEGDLFDGSVKHINVEQSLNFVFANPNGSSGNNVHAATAIETKDEEQVQAGSSTRCSICKLKFDTTELLESHQNAPGLPDIVTGISDNKKRDISKAKNKHDQPDTDEDGKKQQSSKSKSFQPICIEDATILIETTVQSRFNGKRIKWLCRQEAFSKFIKSKSQCEVAIKKGRVFINRKVAIDSSRIVRENDVISLVEEYDSNYSQALNENDCNDDSRLVKEISSLGNKNCTIIEVVYKPVGIRSIGSFNTNTLEMITKKNAERRRGTKEIYCHPISKIDTGCAGLCVLVTSTSTVDKAALDSIKVLYTFTALVHGQLPEQWKDGVYVQIPKDGKRQWKRQKTEQHGLNSTTEVSSKELDLNDALFIKCIDTLRVDEQQFLSTLTIQSRFDDGRLANVISYVLRKLGYCMVNDRLAKREYSALPRRIKNIVKQKICIGCYGLDIEYQGKSSVVSIDPHKRTQCSFWREELA